MIGLMQGRLSPPVEGKLQAFPPLWERELPQAKTLGFQCMEWVHESPDPLNTPSKIAHIREQGMEHIPVIGLDADYFLQFPLITRSGTIFEPACDHLWWLIQRADQLRLHHITLPFLERTSLKSDAQRMALVDLCKRVAIRANQVRVEVHLETDLHPDWVIPIYQQHPRIKDCYDTGNRAALGYGVDDLQTLVPYVGSVHLKDRLVKGPSVAPGHGSVKWDGVFPVLEPLLVPIILQFQRGQPGAEAATCAAHLRFVRDGLAV